MKAYLWRTGIEILPFRDPVRDSLIINRPLHEHQVEILSSFGLEVSEIDDPSSIDDPEYILVKDNLYFSKTLFKRFWKKLRSGCSSGACALEKGPFTEFTRFIQDLRVVKDPETGTEAVLYGLFYIRGGLTDLQSMDRLPPIIVQAEQKPLPIDPASFMPSSVQIQLNPAYTDATIMHICHWVHLWLINLMVLGSTLMEAFLRSKIKLVFRVLSAFSLNKHTVANRFVVKGRHCDIHPTAVVQACILGDHVKIGPYAIVQGSVLGDYADIPEQSIVIGSVLGEKASTCNRGVLKLCVLYPGGSGGKMQGCLLGRNVFIADFALFFDVKLEGTIRVRHQGRYVDTGMGFLGGCVGHNAIVGAGNWIDSGREIPNGSTVVKNRDDIISRVPSDLPDGELLTVRKGVLTRFSDLQEKEEGVDPKRLLPDPSLKEK